MATGRRGSSPAAGPALTALAALAGLWRFNTLRLANWYFHDADPSAIVEAPLFGYRLPLRVHRSGTHRLLCLQRERAILERRLVAGLLASGATVVDVGANVGYYLLLIAREIGPSGTVICIEPEPENLEELRRCIEVNGLRNVEVMAAAAGERRGEVRLARGVNGRVTADPTGAVTVPACCLDELIDRRPDVVKIDVEGFEGQVLRGAQQLIRACTPRLFVEVHPALLTYGYSVADVLALLRPHYPRISFHEAPTDHGPLDALVARYLPGRALRAAPSLEALMAGRAAASRDRPFWVVCGRTD